MPRHSILAISYKLGSERISYEDVASRFGAEAAAKVLKGSDSQSHLQAVGRRPQRRWQAGPDHRLPDRPAGQGRRNLPAARDLRIQPKAHDGGRLQLRWEYRSVSRRGPGHHPTGKGDDTFQTS